MGIEDSVTRKILSLVADSDRRDVPPLPRGSWMPVPRFPAAILRKESLLALADQVFPPAEEGQSIVPGPVAVVGPPGMGKTQLVLEFCQQYAQCFAGIHWLDARLNSNLAAEVAWCGHTMNLPDLSGPVALQAESVLEAWTTGRRLVVLDNLGSVETLAEWLPRFGGAHVIITTSTSEGLAEQGVQTLFLGPFTQHESLTVLRRIAHRLRREKDADLEALAGWLVNVPLAVTLAGRYLREHSKLSLGEYMDALKNTSVSLNPALSACSPDSPMPGMENMAAAFLHVFRSVTGRDDLGRLCRMIICAASYCAPDLPIPQDLLMRVARGNADNYDQFERALALLAQYGIINESDEGPWMHPLVSDLARQCAEDTANVIENLAEMIGPFAQSVFAQQNLRESLVMQAHLEAFVPWVENARLPQAGVLWNSLGYQRSLMADLQQARRSLERALALNEKDFGPDDYRLSAILVNLGRVLNDLHDFSGARRYFEWAARISDDYKIANELYNLSATFLNQHDLESARSCLEQAFPIIEKTFGSEYPLFATYMTRYGQVLMELDRLEDAKACFERVLAIQEKMYSSRPNQAQVAVAYSNLGLVHKRMGDLPAAKAFFEHALQTNDNPLNFSRDDLQVARDSNNLGRVLRSMGDLHGARTCFSSVLSINERARGLEIAEVTKALISMGLVLRELGEPQAAKPYFERALLMDELAYHAKDPGVATDLHRMGLAMSAMGDLPRARESFAHAADLEEKMHGPNHPNVATNLHHLGRVLQQLGSMPEAKAAYERALEIDRQKYGPNHPYVATDINDLGSLLQDMKDLPGARMCFGQALAIDENAYGPDHPSVARDMNNLGSVQKAQGDLLGAKASFARAVEIFEAFHGADHRKTQIARENLQSVLRRLNPRGS